MLVSFRWPAAYQNVPVVIALQPEASASARMVARAQPPCSTEDMSSELLTLLWAAALTSWVVSAVRAHFAAFQS